MEAGRSFDYVDAWLRRRTRRGYEYEAILAPSKDVMQQIAFELREAEKPSAWRDGDWVAIYFPDSVLRYTATDVSVQTGERGIAEPHESFRPASCSFRHRDDYCVSFVWDSPDEYLPRCVVHDGFSFEMPAGLQKDLSFGRSHPIIETETDLTLLEGAIRAIELNIHERNRRARDICLKAHGSRCVICKFDFGAAYGEIAADFIHVHHRERIADTTGEHALKPAEDLVPLCPNCHSVVHLRVPPFDIEDVKRMMATARLDASSWQP